MDDDEDDALRPNFVDDDPLRPTDEDNEGSLKPILMDDAEKDPLRPDSSSSSSSSSTSSDESDDDVLGAFNNVYFNEDEDIWEHNDTTWWGNAIKKRPPRSNKALPKKGRKKAIACKFCAKDVPESAVLVHLRSHQETLCECIACPFKAEDESELMRHLDEKHFTAVRAYGKSYAESAQWTCRRCAAIIVGLNDFIRHNAEVHEDVALECPECGRSDFTSKLQLRGHVVNHDDQQLPCEYCGKTFASVAKMKRHVKDVHEGQRRFMCNECGKCFTRRDKLRVHEAIHLDVKPFLCQRCGRRFTRQEHVQRHQEKVCGKQKTPTIRKNEDEEILDLERELGIDVLERNPESGMFHCMACDHPFKHKRYIAEHFARNHRDENLKLPYKCEECASGFKLKKDLIAHMNKPHDKEKEKKFVCEEDGCGLRFPREYELEKHARIHRGIRDWKCESCDASFHWRQCLMDHAKVVHNVILPKAPKNRNRKPKKKGDGAKKRRKPAVKKAKVEAPLNAFCPPPPIAHVPEIHHPVQESVIWPSSDPPLPLELPKRDVQVNESIPLPLPPTWQPFEAQNANVGIETEAEVKKTRHQGAPMTEEERTAFEENLSEKNLGSVCSVCGKVFRNRDALDFHIMNTKMPGHKLLQQKHVKSKYAFESIQVSSRLSMQIKRDDVDEEDALEAPFEAETDPEQPMMDPTTGEFVVNVKCEEPKAESEEEEDMAELPLSISIKVEEEVEEEMEEEDFASSRQFRCFECQKGFKKQSKLLKHVKKRHGVETEKRPKSEPLSYIPEDVMGDVAEMTKDAKDVTGRWNCAICGKSLANKQKLTRHITEVHQRLRNHVCGVCSKTFARAEKLRIHEREAHDEETVANAKPKPLPGIPAQKAPSSSQLALKLSPMGCLDCDLVFVDKDSLMAHMAQAPHNLVASSTSSSLPCPITTCNLHFTSSGRLFQHLRNGKHNQPCPVCGKEFKRLDKLELHLRCHSSDRPYACDDCDKTYKDPTSLQSHKKTHTGARPYACNECGSAFMKPDHLKRHVNSTHLKIKNVKCSFCDKMFADKYKAKIHERKHTGETPFLCSICAKAFKRKEALEQHAIVHKTDLPRDYKCLTCSATFKSQAYLNRHVSRHFAERRWKCPLCPSAFIDRRDLVTHDKHVHQNIRPFVCGHCGSAYKTKQGLGVHTKAYPTGDCLSLKRFSGRGANRVEIVDEEENGDFECQHCKKSFGRKTTLHFHMRTAHAEARPQTPCPVAGCQRAFPTKQALKNHMKSVHHYVEKAPSEDVLVQPDDQLLQSHLELRQLSANGLRNVEYSQPSLTPTTAVQSASSSSSSYQFPQHHQIPYAESTTTQSTPLEFYAANFVNNFNVYR